MQKSCILKWGEIIGRTIIDFDELSSSAYGEIENLLRNYPDLEALQIKEEPVLKVSGLEIYPDYRKVYCNHQEINLTVKEYDILCLLVINQGRVLTYDLIYEKVWNENTIGSVNNAIACHIHNLREKIFRVLPEPGFSIQCIREVGYRFEMEPK